MNKDDERIARRCGVSPQELSAQFGGERQLGAEVSEESRRARIERILKEPDERVSFSHRVRQRGFDHE